MIADRDGDRKITYSAAIVFSLPIWGTAEGFGGSYTSGASDIGTAVIYALVFAALLTISYYAGPARYSADYYLEQKISWWWRVAEVRRPAPAEAPALATLNAASAGAVQRLNGPGQSRRAVLCRS